jgi:hypothetical protein
MDTTLLWRSNRKASPGEVLAAQERAILAGLPITVEARAAYGATEKTLEAKLLLESMSSEISLLGDQYESQTAELNWNSLESRLNQLIANPDFSLRAGAVGQVPLVAATNRLSKVMLAEAERRVQSGDWSNGISLYQQFRAYAKHGAFQQTFISMLIGMANWKRLVDSLTRLETRGLNVLPTELVKPPSEPEIRSVLNYEFLFQWDQLSPEDQVTPVQAQRMRSKERSKIYIFLENWALLYPRLENSKGIIEVATGNQHLRSELYPYKKHFFTAPTYSLDVIDWTGLAGSIKRTHEAFEKLRIL